MTTNKYIDIHNIMLDIPIFDSSRSLRKSMYSRYVGGTIHQNTKSNPYVRALDNISFRLKEGDRLALIGHNGAGKTTLLNVLAGIYIPQSGSVKIQGKTTNLFNINLGLDLDDSGYENIYTMGLYLGLSKKEITRKREEIIEFSELGEYIYLPARTYSNGMLMRLSFAIVTSLDTDILLLDEGIGVGDINFAKKSAARLESFYNRIGILVLASHSDELIKKMCNKAILLEHGKIVEMGDVDTVLASYHNTLF